MEFWETSCQWLKAGGMRISGKFVKKRMLSHSEYPALTALIDTLDELQVRYTAARIGPEQLEQIDVPFLAHMNTGDGEDFLLQYPHRLKGEVLTAFLSAWNGVVLYLEAGTAANSVVNDALLASVDHDRKRWKMMGGTMAVLFSLFSILYFDSWAFSLSLLCLTGIFICSQILLRQQGGSSRFLEQFCGDKPGGSCDKILASGELPFVKGIGLGDVGLIYFTGILVFVSALLLNTNNVEGYTLLFLPATGGVVFSFYSLWYQRWVAKSWCKLCLAVLVVLWVQAVLQVIFFTRHTTAIPSAGIVILFFCCMTIAGSWLLVKPMLARLNELDTLDIQLMSWKRKPGVFLHLLSQQPSADMQPWPDDLFTGNAAASLQLMIVCNPYCSPCSATHRQLNTLQAIYPGQVGLTLRFMVNGDMSNDRTRAVNKLVNAYRIHGMTAIDSWFEGIQGEEWDRRYLPDGPGTVNEDLLRRYAGWCLEAGIDRTPTIFLNGYQLPVEYGIPQLQLLLPLIVDQLPVTPAASTA